MSGDWGLVVNTLAVFFGCSLVALFFDHHSRSR